MDKFFALLLSLALVGVTNQAYGASSGASCGSDCVAPMTDTGPRTYGGGLTCFPFEQRERREVWVRFFDEAGKPLFVNLERPEGRYIWDPDVRALGTNGLSGQLCFGTRRISVAFSFEVCNGIQTFKGRRTAQATVPQLIRQKADSLPFLLWLH